MWCYYPKMKWNLFTLNTSLLLSVDLNMNSLQVNLLLYILTLCDYIGHSRMLFYGQEQISE